MTFLRWGRPCPCSATGAAIFDQTRMCGVKGDPPIEAVAAEIHQASPTPEISGDTVEHRCREILGMRSGHDHPIRRQSGAAIAMQVVVGDDIDILAEPIEPIEKDRIECEVPETPVNPVFEVRSQSRSVEDTATVRMRVVGG